jgi:hypothetical protein
VRARASQQPQTGVAQAENCQLKLFTDMPFTWLGCGGFEAKSAGD